MLWFNQTLLNMFLCLNTGHIIEDTLETKTHEFELNLVCFRRCIWMWKEYENQMSIFSCFFFFFFSMCCLLNFTHDLNWSLTFNVFKMAFSYNIYLAIYFESKSQNLTMLYVVYNLIWSILPLVIQKDGNARSISVTEPNGENRVLISLSFLFSLRKVHCTSLMLNKQFQTDCVRRWFTQAQYSE